LVRARGGQDATVRVERLNPQTLHDTPGYHHVTVVGAGRTAHIAGQCPLDVNGNLVGDGDLLAQVDQVVANALAALAAVGAPPSDVVRTHIWVVSGDRADLASVWTRLRGSDLADALMSASTLVGVAQLGFPGQLVELDLTVALD
jgi:enamine deaminase RidA (YjgF/YER057c/UK114 family)